MTARPPGSSAPPSSNSTTPLHSRLQPCPGWLATALAAPRSGAKASGHRGRCRHGCSPGRRAVRVGFWSAIAPPIDQEARYAVLPEAVRLRPMYGSVICTLRRHRRTWRHPKVPWRWNLRQAAEGTKVPPRGEAELKGAPWTTCTTGHRDPQPAGLALEQPPGGRRVVAGSMTRPGCRRARARTLRVLAASSRRRPTPGNWPRHMSSAP